MKSKPAPRKSRAKQEAGRDAGRIAPSLPQQSHYIGASHRGTDRPCPEMEQMDDEAKQMGLTDYEYAFYSAVANNESARELMQQEKLRNWPLS